MLTVIIATFNDEEALARTLASLVPAAVEGLVREVVVVDAGSTDQTHRVADHAGCRMMSADEMAKAILTARGDWIMFLEPGAKPAGDWIEPVAAHISHARTPARFTQARESRQPFLRSVLRRQSPLRDGLIISKGQAAALLRRSKTPLFVRKRLAARRLHARLHPAPAGRKMRLNRPQFPA